MAIAVTYFPSFEKQQLDIPPTKSFHKATIRIVSIFQRMSNGVNPTYPVKTKFS